MLLDRICPEIEARLKPNLGVRGLLAPTFLPQSWVFETEAGSLMVHIDALGNARVLAGAGSDRDVTVQWKQELLASVLEHKGRDSLPSNEFPNVALHTEKGGVAFDYLRKEFGF